MTQKLSTQKYHHTASTPDIHIRIEMHPGHAWDDNVTCHSGHKTEQKDMAIRNLYLCGEKQTGMYGSQVTPGMTFLWLDIRYPCKADM